MLQQLGLFDDHSNLFEKIKHFDEQGNEYWISRELQPVLDYSEWRNFLKVIKKAQTACKKSGNDISSNFVEVNTNVEVGFGLREVDDFKLSRYACYLIAMNGDPSKQVIADAQTYFTVQTRRQEVADEQKKLQARSQAVTGYELKGKSHDWAESRVDAKESHKRLTAALQRTHETHKPDYGKVGAIQNQELFESTKADIVEYLGLLPSQESNYRDYLGKYAHEAIRMSNTVIVDKMNDLGRELTTDEQSQIIKDVTRRIAPTMRDLAEYANVDYISGAKKDRHGKPLITRNVKLLKDGK